MTSKLFLMSAAALILSGTVYADDASSQPPRSTKQMVNDCITKQMASDSSVSRTDAKKTCKDKVKQAQDPTGTNRVGSGSPDKP